MAAMEAARFIDIPGAVGRAPDQQPNRYALAILIAAITVILSLVIAGINALVGWPSDDFIEGRIHLAELVYEEDVPHIEAELEKAIQSRASYRLEYRMRHRDKSLRWISETAAPVLFLANMSHEIRTPMNAILGFTDLVLETPLNDQQTKNLGIVRASGRTLLVLLNDILRHPCYPHESLSEIRGVMEILQ